MYLSKLELFGFKSFAQRVQVKFDSGLTAIVGPNGCGKTNIVDAIRWVLGEQKTSVLRSDKMENVIFSGTKNRRALGLAEITLTIENTKNILPTAYTEVSLTRRLYRSGDSEYFLNKVPCRLKDIHDLFVDTGMGSDAYSVIELKMIEQILSDNTEDRRKMFEEAAGITKYKIRRRQTLRTLESTHQDLDRVKDIVAEVQKKVNSLERQAKKATQAKTIKDELYDLEIAHSLTQLKDFKEKRKPLTEALPGHEQAKQAQQTEITALRTRHEELQLQMINLEKQLSTKQKEFNATSETITNSEKLTLSNQERIKSLDKAKVKAHEGLKNIELKKNELGQLSQQLYQELAGAEEQSLVQKRQYETEKKSTQNSEDALSHTRREIDDKNNDIQNLNHSLSEFRLSVQNLKAKIESIDQNIQRSEDQMMGRKNRIERAGESSADLNRQIERLKEALVEQETHLETILAEQSGLQQDIESQKEALLSKRSALNKTENRVAFLASLLENYEDLPEGIAHLEKSAGESFGLGILSDLFSTTGDEYKKAISAALGENLAYYVTRSKKDALKAIKELRREIKGKVTFILLDHFSQNVSLFSQQPHVLPDAKWAMDTIKTSDEIKPLLQTLLDRTYIVDTLEEAESLSQQYPDLVFACKTGEKLSYNGFLRGGSPQENEGERIGRKEEHEHLKTVFTSLQTSIAAQEETLESKENALKSIDVKAHEQKIKELQSELTALEKRQANLNFEIETYENEIDQANTLLVSESEQKTAYRQQLDELEPKHKQAELELASRQEELQILKASISGREAEHKARVEALQEAGLLVKDAEHRIDTIKASIKRTEGDIRSAQREEERLGEEITLAEEEQFRITSELETINENLKLLYNDKNSLQTAIAELEFQNNALKGDFNSIEKNLRELQTKRDTESEIIHQYKQDISRLDYHIDTIKTVIFQEYDLDLESQDLKLNPEINLENADERITQLKNRLKSLGAVNELALEEFEQEKERLDFLINQRQDLQDSEKQLLDTINEINKTAHEKFITTFTEIRQNFIEIFRDLFHEGDQADLILDPNEDPLEANIDIVAKPKGKRPQSISLLSGGEKTLTAISLLFAIYLVKPSPFCILDEVDAPLDDANIDRFINLLKKFAENTQFIIVTHNKRTMESSRVLYGVTMEEEGISKLVAVKLGNMISDAQTENT